MGCCLLMIIVPSWGKPLMCPGIEEMIRQKIIPDMIDTLPKSVLEVQYDDLKANMGNELEQLDVRKEPTLITWEANPEKLYLISFSSPGESEVGDKPGQLYWLVGNVKGDEVGKGMTLVTYKSPNGNIETGIRKIVTLVYEQLEHITYNGNDYANHGTFSIRAFSKKYNLGEPFAGNFYVTQCKPGKTRNGCH